MGISRNVVDSPFSTVDLLGGNRYVLRNSTLCCVDIFNDKNVQFALIAHEYGHIIANKSNLHIDKPYTFHEEVFADSIAVALGLADHLQIALDKMESLPQVDKDQLQLRKDISILMERNDSKERLRIQLNGQPQSAFALLDNFITSIKQ